MTYLPHAIVVLATFLGAGGMFFIKRGATQFSLHPLKLLRNGKFILGGTLYALSLPLYLYGLKLLPLSVAYPLTSMTYVWVAMLAKVKLGEEVDAWRWTGICIIIIGIVLVAL